MIAQFWLSMAATRVSVMTWVETFFATWRGNHDNSQNACCPWTFARDKTMFSKKNKNSASRTQCARRSDSVSILSKQQYLTSACSASHTLHDKGVNSVPLVEKEKRNRLQDFSLRQCLDFFYRCN